MKILDYTPFDNIKELAKENPRHRMNQDLRTQSMDADLGWQDTPKRMLNVMMKDAVIPIHRHTETTETVIVLRGSGDEVTYDDTGIECITLWYGAECAAVQVPTNVYHTFIPHEDGTVIFEAKDRAYDPDTTEDFLRINS